MSKKVEIHNGIIWARYNGVSIAVNDATERYVAPHGEYENDWQRFKGVDGVEIICNVTGELLCDVTRIPVKKKNVIPADVLEAIWLYEKNIEELMELSLRVYKTTDNDSPLWSVIENEMDAECTLAMRHGLHPDEFVAIYYDPTNRAAHGLQPVEVRHD